VAQRPGTAAAHLLLVIYGELSLIAGTGVCRIYSFGV
jgi:hypothetical protein